MRYAYCALRGLRWSEGLGISAMYRCDTQLWRNELSELGCDLGH